MQDTDCPPTHQGSVLAEYVDELSKSFNNFFLYHTFVRRVQAEGYTAQRNSAKDVAKIVMQVDFAENVTTKINCLRKSVYWPYNQLFAQHVFGSMGEHIQL